MSKKQSKKERGVKEKLSHLTKMKFSVEAVFPLENLCEKDMLMFSHLLNAKDIQ